MALSYLDFLLVDGVLSLTIARTFQGVGLAAVDKTFLTITGELALEEITY